MVRQFRNFKQISGQPVHQLAGSVAVKKIKIQLLKMHIKIASDIRLHANAELMSPVGDDEVHARPQHKRRHNDGHDAEKGSVELVRQEVIHDIARHQWKSDVDRAHEKRAAHIQKKELFVRGKIG